jgi:PhnB protein
MSNTVLQPYLTFPSTAEEAMTYYQGVMGGKLEITRFKDMPGSNYSGDKAELVMHSTLENEHLTFMGSDAMQDGDIVIGSNISLSIAGQDADKITRIYEGLAKDGKVTQPLEAAPWGDTFGMVVDKYGITWMFNISTGDGSYLDAKEESNG